MRADRLQKLADHLRTIQRGFNLSHLIQAGGYDLSKVEELLRANCRQPHLFSVDDVDFDDHDCGTSACAVGNLPLIFPDEWSYQYNLAGSVRLFYEGMQVGMHWDTNASIFFNISTDDAYNLFAPNSYPNKSINDPNAVADRIESFIAGDM